MSVRGRSARCIGGRNTMRSAAGAVAARSRCSTRISCSGHSISRSIARPTTKPAVPTRRWRPARCREKRYGKGILLRLSQSSR